MSFKPRLVLLNCFKTVCSNMFNVIILKFATDFVDSFKLKKQDVSLCLLFLDEKGEGAGRGGGY